jgi:hypothetical protein
MNVNELPIFQPQDYDGNNVGPAYTSWEAAFDAADALGVGQVSDTLWQDAIFGPADEVAERRQAARTCPFCGSHYSEEFCFGDYED